MTYFFCKMILPRSDFIQTMTDSKRNIMKAHGDYLQSLAEVGSIVCHGPNLPARSRSPRWGIRQCRPARSIAEVTSQ
jgi:uncharacterized protein YciI